VQPEMYSGDLSGADCPSLFVADQLIEKERKRLQKLSQEEAKVLSTQSAQTVEEALASINEEDFPTSMEQREKFCMEQLSAGEVLFTQGTSNLPLSLLDYLLGRLWLFFWLTRFSHVHLPHRSPKLCSSSHLFLQGLEGLSSSCRTSYGVPKDYSA